MMTFRVTIINIKHFFWQRKQKDVAKENDFYIQLLQQALPVEQQAANLQQQIQPHVQLQAQVSTLSVEQNSKSQPHRPSPQYNPSPEKSRGSLYYYQFAYITLKVH